MQHRMKTFLLQIICVLVCLGASADNFSFNPLTKFRIQAVRTESSSVAPGSTHGVNSPLCVTDVNATDDDCFWYVQEYKAGQYALRNAKTGEYMTWDDVRSDNPIRRYLNLTTELKGDSSLWTIGVYDEDIYYFVNVAMDNYYFNIRSGSGALGTYAHGSSEAASNEIFYILKEDGSYYDPGKDYNDVCGQDEQGLYWTSYGLDVPVVMTTNPNSPVYYYIRNSRSMNWVEPLTYAGWGSLSQDSELPKTRFYFVEAEDGVQIMVEGGNYVSGKFTDTMNTTDSDVTVVSGSPKVNDHTWSITWSSRGDYEGYAIGVKTCSENSENNIHIITGRTFWNDYSSGGICWFTVDGGSTFTFLSKDARHRDYLASKGLVTPGSTAPVDTIPVDTSSVDPSELEPISGPVVYVYRADGRVEAIPQEYIKGDVPSLPLPGSALPSEGLTFTLMPKASFHKLQTISYAAYEVDSLSYVAPELPEFNSFKFNNKFNPHIIGDAIGVYEEDSLITLQVVGIGKTLRPSFKLDDDVQAWIGDSLQHSKVTRVRFDKDVVYTVARCGQTILRRTGDGQYVTRPYGREVTVRVDFATDHSTGECQVPTVYITTNDGTSINSKSYYRDGKISIDGAGVFPDLPETDMQIKGRGNSSWTSTGKAPYHFKFENSIKVLGLKKGKHWNLIANAINRSMTTNAIAMKMAQLVEAAGFNHEIPVELYINGEYRGSYNLTEKIGLSNNSVDLEDESYATLLELDSYYDETYKFRSSSFNLPINIKEPDFSEGTTKLTQSMIEESVNRVWDTLYRGEDMQYVVDLDYLARFLLVDEFSENYELFHPKSTFWYNPNLLDSSSTFVFGPVWDFDWGYGYQYSGGYFNGSPAYDFWSRSSMEASAWGHNLRYCGTNFDKIYYQTWHRFMTTGCLDDLIDFCDDYYQFAAPSYTHDNTRWRHGDATTYATITEKSKDWLRKRANYIYDYLGNTLGYNAMGYLNDYDTGVLMGDANGDGSVTTSDLVAVLNYMLNLPNEDFKYEQADTDKNNMITVADIIGVRNIVETSGIKSGTFYGLPEANATIATGSVSYTEEGVTIPLTISVADGDYSGLQFDLRIPEGMTIDNIDISHAIPDFDITVAELDNGQRSMVNGQCYRVSIYSSAKHKLPVGKSELTLELGKNNGQCSMINGQLLSASLSNVLFSTALGEDERSQSRTAEFTSEELTGLNSAVAIVGQQGNSVTLSSSEAAVVPVYGADGRVYRLYSLKGGRETITLPPGVYIINKQKIIIR